MVALSSPSFQDEMFLWSLGPRLNGALLEAGDCHVVGLLAMTEGCYAPAARAMTTAMPATAQ